MRKTKEELNEICSQFGVKTLWSWSRYNAYKTDTYGYYLKYTKNIKPDLIGSIYSVSGNKSHDIIELFYKEDLNHQGMFDAYEAALMEFDFAELKYDRSDDDKNDAIAKKYEACMRHFFLHHNKINEKVFLEKFIIIKIGDYYFQGYIDAFHKEVRDGVPKIIVTDWKTSSVYKGEKINKEKGQLILYAEGMRQKLGCKLDDIIIRWNFLKYVEIEYTESKGNKKTRIVERNNIGSSLKANAKMWLKKDGYTADEIEDFIDEMIDRDSDYTNNSIEVLPESVQDRYVIRDCYVEIPLNQDVVNELKEEIISTINEINDKTKEYEKTQDEMLFWQDVTKESSYFMANLSDYSANIHKPYKKYLEDLKLFTFTDDDGEEGNNSESSNSDIKDDLDWLFN